MSKKVLSMLLAVMLLITIAFTACGKQADEVTQAKDEQSSSSNAQTEQTKVDEKADPFGKIEPAVEITAVRQATPEQTVKYANGDSDDNNVWTRTYEEQLGVKLKYLWKTPFADGAQYTQKLNLSIASGELPDLFLVDKSQFKQLIDADQILDLSQIYEKFASDFCKGIITGSGPEPLETSKFSGKLMGIPWTTLFKENVNLIYVRADWMKKLNLQDPKNMEDVLKISDAFTNQDPDGNGKKDTFGLVFENSFEFHKGFFNSYHAYPEMWIKDASGNLVFGNIQPEMKNALLKLQELYKSGQIDKEFVTKDLVKSVEALTSGKAGMFYGPFSIPAWPLQETKNLDPNTEYNYYPLQSIDNEPAKPQYSVNGILGCWVVKKGNEKHAEALVKMLNLFVEKMYNNKGDKAINDKYIAGPEGETWQCAFVRAYPDWGNWTHWSRIKDVMNGKLDVNKLENTAAVYDIVMKYVKDKDNKNWGMANIYTEPGALKVIDYYKSNDLFKMDEFYGPATEEMVAKTGNLLKLRDEAFTKIIMGASIDEFDKYVNEWKKQGGDEITQQINEWYTSK